MRSKQSKTIILHPGTHKTGSSAIVWSLHEFRPHLNKHGIDYIPGAKKMLRGIVNQETVSDSDMEGAQRQFDEMASGLEADKLIVSYEDIFGNPRDGYPRGNNSTNLERVRRIMNGYPIHAIVFLRRQDLFVESMYAHMVKKSYEGSFQDYLNSLPVKCFDWNRMIKNYEEQLGPENVAILPYGNNAVDQFYEYLEIPAPSWDSEKKDPVLEANRIRRMNYSLNLHGMELKRHCNTRLDESGKTILRKMMQKHFPRNTGEAFHLFSGRDRIQYMDVYQAGNQDLENRYGKTLFPDTGSIDTSIQSSLDFPPKIDEQTVNLICRLATLVGEQKKKNSSK